jgi:hypothetical protein
LILLTLTGSILGTWLSLSGLFIRVFGQALSLGGGLAWAGWLPAGAGITPQMVGWPLVVVGTAWFGALCGLWLRLGWAYRVSVGLGLVSLLYPGLGTALALGALICLWVPPTRRWVFEDPGRNGP